MHSPSQARSRFSFKASHRRMTLKISHATMDADAAPARKPSAPQRTVSAPVTRERYIAPPRRGRR